MESKSSSHSDFRREKPPSTLRRVGAYALVRIFTIAITITLGVFITVVMANKNNGIDNSVARELYAIAQRQVWDEVSYSIQNSFKIQQLIGQRIVELEHDAGLYDPFLIKHLRWTWNALQIKVGDTVYTNTSVGEATTQERNNIRKIILDRLPNTLMIIGVADLLVFAIGIPLSLYLSRQYGTWFDKVINVLSPLSSVPSWVIGVLLIIVFAVTFKLLPPGGMIDVPIPKTRPEYLLSRLRHMILPITAVFLNLLFQLVYSWRNFFMIYSNEDYVEFGVAQGLPWRKIQNKYILRPALPYVLTSFALTLVSFWQMTIALEVVFGWDGIGSLYIGSLPNFWGDSMFPGEMGMTVGIVVLFAYFLGVVVLVLDVAYALVDPRIRLGAQNEHVRANRSPQRQALQQRIDSFLNLRHNPIRKMLVVGAVILAAGGVLGLVVGRQTWLLAKEQSTPASLARAFQLDYLEMSVESFVQDQNSYLLRSRYDALGSSGSQVFQELIASKKDDSGFQEALAFLIQNYEGEKQDEGDLAGDLAGSEPRGMESWLPVVLLIAFVLAAGGVVYVFAASRRGRLVPIHLFVAAGGILVFGMMLGVGVSRLLWPLHFRDMTPADLQHEYQVDYACLLINSYGYSEDVGQVHTRLAALGEEAEHILVFVVTRPFQAAASPVNIERFTQNFEEYVPEREIIGSGAAQESPEELITAQADPLSLAELMTILGVVLLLAVVLLLLRRRILYPESEGVFTIFQRQGRAVSRVLKGMLQYPSAVIGFVILGLMIIGALYGVIRYPYSDVGEDWYTDTSLVTKYVPKLAKPEWVNFFRKSDYAETIVMDSHLEPEYKTVETLEDGRKSITFKYAFDYPYDDFPSEAILYFDTKYEVKSPFVIPRLLTPDGREISLRNFSIPVNNYLKLDEKIDVRQFASHHVSYKTNYLDIYSEPILNGLFMNPDSFEPEAVSGRYVFEIEVLTFEPETDVDIEFVLLGNVYGVAGTDINRRDLLVPLLWGMPFALVFGLLGALLTTFVSMALAAIGVWFGGWTDNLIQRVTEANMILPVVAIAVLFYAFYGLDLWAVLLIIVVLNAFGSPIKTFRAAFIQVKQASFIEAAQAYGATNSRIIFRYMVPRILPVLIPQLVTLVPSYIFLEATLGMLKVESFSTPTWGKVIYNALANGAVVGSKFWVLEPIALLLLTGFAFSMMGTALERVLNPRLLEGD